MGQLPLEMQDFLEEPIRTAYGILPAPVFLFLPNIGVLVGEIDGTGR